MPLIFKRKIVIVLIIITILALAGSRLFPRRSYQQKGQQKGFCLTGAFLTDMPTTAAIDKFQKDYEKKPFFVLTFLDWGKFPDSNVIRDVYGQGAVLMVTWEPWNAISKTGIAPEALLKGEYDAYVFAFALALKKIEAPVFLRFAHEMNGDWYPWSGQKIGGAEYQKMYKYIHEIFDRIQATNVRWVFSINADNVPPENNYALCYPGNPYVDYIGLDGYNWGTTQSWSQWRTFSEIFSSVYSDVVRRYQKPVIISEFSTTSEGGSKSHWIEAALKDVKAMPAIKGFVLFNVNKETDWYFPPGSENGRALREGLADPYFIETTGESF